MTNPLKGAGRWLVCGAGMAVLMTANAATVGAAPTKTQTLPVPPEAHAAASSWPYPDHDPSNSRLATDSPIDAADLNRLTTAWTVAASGGLPTSPIIVGHSAFVEDQVGEVFDIDLDNGHVQWKSQSNGYSVGPEGIAVGWGKVFGVTPTSLFALDEGTGAPLWSTRLTHTTTDGIDVQPQVVGHDVIASTVPVSVKGIYIGGDRGYIDAVDESSGKLQWGFDTVASPTVWGNPSVNSGGGSWYPPSFSARRGLLFVGIANPAPFVGTSQYPNGTSRPGRNLYTDSTVALHVDTGKLAWYHQATPHDLFDRDFVHTMVVSVPAAAGHPAASVVVGTGKGGFVIGMNPSTGKQLWRTNVGIHHNDNLKVLTGPTTILPGTFGGVLTPPGFARGKVFVAALNAPDTLYPDRTEYFGGKTGTMRGQVVALDGRTGRPLWNTRIPGDPTGGVTLVNNVVLTATLQGSIIGLSMASGKILWKVQAPGGIDGWMSVSGRTIIVPVGDATPPTIMALRLPH
jgi:glucose dehydrogenase